jgi:hypothetical protein
MESEKVRDLLAGSRSSAAARRAAALFTETLSDKERRAVLASPESSRRYGWLALSPHMPRLRVDAYAVHAFADDDTAKGKDSTELRDWVSNTFRCEQPVLVNSAPPRESFVAWRIFQERTHAKKVYIARSVVGSGMRAAGLPPNAADASLVSSPTSPDLATHVEIAKYQASVRAFVKNASVVNTRVVATMDLSSLDAVQKRIAQGIVTSPFSVLTGGAGTGKSTLISVVVRAYLEMKLPIVCLAPTHRAKKNLAKRLPPRAEVATVDAFIRTRPSAGASTPRMLIVDEGSMLDLEKTARLARKAMDFPAWQVCFAGDDGQLEPISRGEIFRTAIHNGGAHIFKLEKCYRAENVDLFDAHLAIRNGSMPSSSASVLISLLDSDTAVEAEVKAFVKKHGAETQFIAWTNKTCDLVNRLVQRKHSGPTPTPGIAMVGDRVVYCGRNDIKRNLTNAMCGVVVRIKGPHTLVVDWEDGGGELDCATSDAPLAYCITVHKAQGSEYDRVCVVATSVEAMTRSLDRRWLYTAVSRAKRQCTILSTKALRTFVERPLQKREVLGINFASASNSKA